MKKEVTNYLKKIADESNDFVKLSEYSAGDVQKNAFHDEDSTCHCKKHLWDSYWICVLLLKRLYHEKILAEI